MKTRINPLVPASLILSLWAIWPAVLAEDPEAAATNEAANGDKATESGETGESKPAAVE